MTKEFACEFCEKRATTRWGLPQGWFALKDPGELLVCSPECMYAIFAAIKQEEWGT